MVGGSFMQDVEDLLEKLNNNKLSKKDLKFILEHYFVEEELLKNGITFIKVRFICKLNETFIAIECEENKQDISIFKIVKCYEVVPVLVQKLVYKKIER